MSVAANERVAVGIIGIAGYAKSHLSSIAALAEEGECELRAAVVRPQDAEPEREEELARAGATIYRSVEEMLGAESGRVELIANPTGIPAHAELTIASLNAGYHVLCEKPVAGTVADGLAMKRSAEENARTAAIGFQHIYSQALQRLKRVRVDGTLGRLIEARTIVLWPRTDAYYRRNAWAGRIEASGKKIYDSPAQNATSHYLHAMLYVAGTTADASAVPSTLYGENYRAKQIACADTQFVRIVTEDDVTIVHICSHAVATQPELRTEYRFEKGTVTFSSADSRVWFTGESEEADALTGVHGIEEDANQLRMEAFRNVIHAVRDGSSPLCTIDNAIVHTQCIERLFEDAAPIVDVAPAHIHRTTVQADGDSEINDTIRGLEDTAAEMYERKSGYAEVGAPWGVLGRTVRVPAVDL